MVKTETTAIANDLLKAVSKTRVEYDASETAADVGMMLAQNITNWKDKENPKSAPIDIIDLFCGCGGVSAGFLALNNVIRTYRIIGSADIDKDACNSYQQLGISPMTENIRELSDDTSKLTRFLKRINYDRSRPLILIGCPPCQGFSSHRKKNWQKEDDNRNDLVGHFGKIVSKINPDYMFMENVPELLSKRYEKYYNPFLNTLKSAGFNVVSKIVNMAEFGLPQARRRTIVLASKGYVSLPKPFLQSENFVTVRKSIGHLPKIKPGETNRNDPLHMSAKHRKSTVDVIKSVPKNGGSRPKGIGPKCLDRIKGFSDVYGRLKWDMPSITITAYARNPASGRYVHPEQHRGLSIREAATLQGFPHYYEFEGSFDAKFSQIGNAVPPLFASYIGAHILGNLANNAFKEKQIENQSLLKSLIIPQRR